MASNSLEIEKVYDIDLEEMSNYNSEESFGEQIEPIPTGMLDEIYTLLVANNSNDIPCTMMTRRFHEDHYGIYPSEDLSKTLMCKKDFKPKNRNYDICLKEYYVKTFYCIYHDDYGKKTYEGYHRYCDGQAIVLIKDATDQYFFLSIKIKMSAECDTCDGTTKVDSQLVYSDDLKDLIFFVYTRDEIEKIINFIK